MSDDDAPRDDLREVLERRGLRPPRGGGPRVPLVGPPRLPPRARADRGPRRARGARAGAHRRGEANAKALNAATLFELDDGIDPAETRGLIAATLAAAPADDPRGGHRFVDTW